MTVDIQKENGELTVKLEGRLDSTTAGDLDEILLREQDETVKKLTVDLEQVDFISSKGLRVLVGAYKRMDGREMFLSNPNSSITELLRLSGLLKVFTIV